MRINALHALGKFGESTAAAIVSALTDPAVSVRRHAIAALEKTGDKRTISQLEQLARNEHEASVQRAANRALKTLRG